MSNDITIHGTGDADYLLRALESIVDDAKNGRPVLPRVSFEGKMEWARQIEAESAANSQGPQPEAKARPPTH
jgi:hypothetical protein